MDNSQLVIVNVINIMTDWPSRIKCCFFLSGYYSERYFFVGHYGVRDHEL